MARLRVDVTDERVADLMSAWGVPYVWGAGGPSAANSSWPDGAVSLSDGADPNAVGWDCSGFAQAALVRLGLLLARAPRLNASALYARCTITVSTGTEQLGDLAFYGQGGVAHVMLCLGGGVVIGATGGDHLTRGDQPRAFVQLQRINYRTDLWGARRLPPVLETAP